MKFLVSGFINKNIKITEKEFTDMNSVNTYLNSILNKYDAQVEEVYESQSRTNLVVNDYSRLFIERI